MELFSRENRQHFARSIDRLFDPTFHIRWTHPSCQGYFLSIFLFFMSTFESFGLSAPILSNLTRLGYKEPTKVQAEVIPLVMAGRNVVGQSQTGTGKTGAFAIPLINGIDPKSRNIQVVVLGPTRELVTQIKDDFINFSRGTGVEVQAIFGGSSVYLQREALRRRPQVLVATPGRALDFIERRVIDLSQVKFFVLDEVDRMLDMGFVEDIEMIWSKVTGEHRALAFSATLTTPIKNIIERHLGVDYTYVRATETIVVEKIDHAFESVPRIEKYDVLKRHLTSQKGKKTIVFTETKINSERLARMLSKDGFRAGCINGDLPQSRRFRILESYKKGLLDILVTTDVAARGLNMGEIHLVINFDVPRDPESYVHRIGRTGRAGKSGKAVMLVSDDENFMLRNVERSNKIKIKKIDAEGNEVVRQEREERGGSGSSFGGRGRRPSGGRGGYRGGYSSRPYDRSSRPSHGGYRSRPQSDSFTEPREDRPARNYSDRAPARRPYPSRNDYTADRTPDRRDTTRRPSVTSQMTDISSFSDVPRRERPAYRNDRSFGSSEQRERPTYRSDRPFEPRERPASRSDRPFEPREKSERTEGSERSGRPQYPRTRTYHREDDVHSGRPAKRPFRRDDRRAE
jgi:ATP-dependent RNA helicase DeaD